VLVSEPLATVVGDQEPTGAAGRNISDGQFGSRRQLIDLSLDTMAIVLFIEEAFRVHIDGDDFDQMKTVKDISLHNIS
jgi:hypothetical protein